MKPNDIICRRVPIGFLNVQVAEELLPYVVDEIAKEHKWTAAQKKEELKQALENL